MDENYDAIVCGTGLIECVLSGLLSTNGYKVLHIDRNEYYGGESASLNLNQLYAKFNKGEPPASLGRPHLYNVDLIPKVLMVAGELVRILRATVVERYNMEFMLINNSFVQKGGKIHKVPATETEALKSGLMGFFEKRTAAKFFAYMSNYDPADQKTHGGYDLKSITMRDLLKKFGVGTDTIEFIGHAVALHTNDAYLDQMAYPTVMKCKLYEDSFEMHGGSPYVYPLYGSGELPQAFSRLCAVYGGTYMLGTPIDKVNFVNGKFDSIESKGQTCKAKFIVGDPSYFQDRVKPVGKVVRAIVLMSKPIPDIHDSQSCQIIIPQKELKRTHDMYVLQLAGENKVCPEGTYVAIIGTTVENYANPEADIEAGLKLLPAGGIIEKFISVSDLYEPLDNGVESKCFISKSYDSATHFESAAENILEMFHAIHGKPYNFDTDKSKEEETVG